MSTLLTIALALLLFNTNVYAEPTLQSHASIYQVVKETLDKKLTGVNDYQIDIMLLDSRLQLPECTEVLKGFTVLDTVKAGRISVGVRCDMNKRWSIFVSAQVKVYDNVLTLAKPLQRGELITQTALASERREVSKLRDDYFSDLRQVVNKQATRALAVGTVLNLHNVSEPLQVKKGDRVVIRNQCAGLAITMGGEAMMDGVKGQRIRVKNLNSGRIINATVEEPGLVSVR